MAKKTLILNTTIEGCALQWRDPKDRSRDFSNSIEPWIELAKILERGKLNAFFVADHLSLFDVYKGPGNYSFPARTGHKVPRVDPSAAVSAMAQATKSLGFGITFSTVSEHPYHFARRLATLDHFTGGRVGWNIVSSYLDSTGRQLLNGEPLPEHDKRYQRTSEYLDVVYKLLLSSWRDDAVAYDRENCTFVDPGRLRTINHEGDFFKVEGPGVSEPTPQRFPVIIQAGTSSRGKEFAAENAEIIYVDSTDLNSTAENIKKIKELASTKFGRDSSSIKFIIHALPILGRTHEEAIQKQKEISRASIPDSLEIGLSCITGFDLGKYDLDDPLDIIVKKKSNAIQGVTQGIINRALEDEHQKKKQKRIPTKREFLESYTSKNSSLVGTPEEVAAIIEGWVENYDIDGINFGLHRFPDSANDLVDLLVPELQKRGLFWRDYAAPGGTFRENINAEKGFTFVPETHPAHKFRWTPEHTKEQFEAKFEKDYLQIKSKRTL